MNGLVKRTNSNILVNFGLDTETITAAKDSWNNYASEIGNTPLVTTIVKDNDAYVAFETASDIHDVFKTIVDFASHLSENAIFDDKTAIILRATLSGIANGMPAVLNPTENIIYDGFKLALHDLADEMNLGDGPLYTAVNNAIDAAEAALTSESPTDYIKVALDATHAACVCATAIASTCNNVAPESASTAALTATRQFTNDLQPLSKLNSRLVLELVQHLANTCAEAYENHLIAQYASYDEQYV